MGGDVDDGRAQEQQQKPTRRLAHTQIAPPMAGSKPLMQLLNQRPTYAVPLDAIRFVATEDEWLRCVERLRAAAVLGLDTETKPEFRKPPPGRKPNPCSLLQIATRDARGVEEVFVLDLLTLSPKLYNAALADVFLSKRVLKLGQGFYQDLKELALSYPSATCFRVAKHVVELNDLSISLLGGGGHHPLSLQKLVFLYLDRKLTKTQQTSNWARRPLAASQLHYAAADALVLIHLYDELMKRMALARPGFQVESVANVLDVHVPPAPKCNLCFSIFASIAALKVHRKECIATVHTLEICAGCNKTPLETAEAMRQHVSECSSEIGSDDSSCVVVRLVQKQKTTKKETMSAAVPAALATTKSTRSRKRSHSVSAASNEAPAPAAATTSKRVAQQMPVKAAQQQTPEAPQLTKKQAKRQRQREKKLQAQLIKEAEANAAIKQPASSNPVESATADATESKHARKRRRQQERKKAEAAAGQKQQQNGVRTPTRKMSVESSLLASDAIWSQVSTDYSSSLFSP